MLWVQPKLPPLLSGMENSWGFRTRQKVGWRTEPTVRIYEGIQAGEEEGLREENLSTTEAEEPEAKWWPWRRPSQNPDQLYPFSSVLLPTVSTMTSR